MNGPSGSACMFCAATRTPLPRAARHGRRQGRERRADDQLGGTQLRRPRAGTRPGRPPSRRPSCASSSWRRRPAFDRPSQRLPRYAATCFVHQRLHPRQLPPLHQLQRGAAPGGEPVDAIGQPELRERGGGVAAADHGRPGCPGHGLGHGAGAGGKRLELEGAHRAVPEHRARPRRWQRRRRPPCAGRCRAPSSRPGPRPRRARGARCRRRTSAREPGPRAARDRSGESSARARTPAGELDALLLHQGIAGRDSLGARRS